VYVAGRNASYINVPPVGNALAVIVLFQGACDRRRRLNVEQERTVRVPTMVAVGQLIKSGLCGGQLLTQLLEFAERGVGVSERSSSSGRS
jgi:hypothetical protein